MKRFQFRLETILKLKERELQRALEDLAEASRKRAATELRLNRGMEAVKQVSAALDEMRRSPLTGTVHAGGAAAMREAQGFCEQIGKELADLIDREGEARNTYVESKARLGALERLRDRMKDRHQAEEIRKEELETEELVLARRAFRIEEVSS